MHRRERKGGNSKYDEYGYEKDVVEYATVNEAEEAEKATHLLVVRVTRPSSHHIPQKDRIVNMIQ